MEQQRLQPLGSDTLTRRPRLLPVGVVNQRVAGVDLDDVVHEEQPRDAHRVDRFVGCVGEGERHHGDVPRVLGGVLAPRTVGDDGTT
jgi:hypothetical protein